MKTVTRNIFIQSAPEKVFETLDNLGVTGMHMTKSSAMMMGSKLNLEYLTANHTGLGSTYRWTGKMMGMKMDFTVEVTKWVNGTEKTWETIGEARMIIYSWYRMHLLVRPKGNTTEAELSITYERPATIIVMGFNSIGVIQSVVNKKKIRCACLGAVFNLPMSTVTIMEDLLMVVMSGMMLAGMV